MTCPHWLAGYHDGRRLDDTHLGALDDATAGDDDRSYAAGYITGCRETAARAQAAFSLLASRSLAPKPPAAPNPNPNPKPEPEPEPQRDGPPPRWRFRPVAGDVTSWTRAAEHQHSGVVFDGGDACRADQAGA